MLLVGSLVAFRIIFSGVFTGPVLISIVKLIQSFDMPLMYIAIFKYINFTFDEKFSATLYLVGYQSVSQLGVVGLSPTIGKFIDVLGYRMAYLYLGLIVVTFVVISFFGLNKTQVQEAEVMGN